MFFLTRWKAVNILLIVDAIEILHDDVLERNHQTVPGALTERFIVLTRLLPDTCQILQEGLAAFPALSCIPFAPPSHLDFPASIMCEHETSGSIICHHKSFLFF